MLIFFVSSPKRVLKKIACSCLFVDAPWLSSKQNRLPNHFHRRGNRSTSYTPTRLGSDHISATLWDINTSRLCIIRSTSHHQIVTREADGAASARSSAGPGISPSSLFNVSCVYNQSKEHIISISAVRITRNVSFNWPMSIFGGAVGPSPQSLYIRLRACKP